MRTSFVTTLFSTVAAFGVACGGEDAEDQSCHVPTGPGTTHEGRIDADETWTAADGPHVVTWDVQIAKGTLTIEPCAVVRLKEGRGFVVGGGSEDAAALVARGERVVDGDGNATIRLVEFGPETAGEFWGSIQVFETGRVDLEHAILRRAGDQGVAQNYGGAIVASGDGGPTLTRNVRTVSVSIEDSGGFGVNLQSFAAFSDDSAGLVIRGSGQQSSTSAIETNNPIFVAPPAIQSLPAGTYTGNAADEIFVFNQFSLQTDEQFHDRGVPYRMDSTLTIRPAASMAEGGLVTLTLDPGVTIKVGKGNANVYSFNLGASNGSAPENLWPTRLVADGTPEKPIVLTSAASTPAPGDWVGIEWGAGPPEGNVIDNVRLEYAGADSGTASFGCGPNDNDAALLFTNWHPSEDFISALTISDSASGGIVSGWISDDDGPNFKDGNTFTNIGNGCDVSMWQSESPPACPGNDSVPDCL